MADDYTGIRWGKNEMQYKERLDNLAALDGRSTSNYCKRLLIPLIHAEEQRLKIEQNK